MTDRTVLSVTQLNRLAAGALAERFDDIWVEGEVSNFKAYPSGHLYFALKDEGSQIAAVCFRYAAQRLKFELEDGMLVVAHGKLDIYLANGKYQVVLDTIEPKGVGALQKAFEQLKKKLAAEGLFAAERKRPIPDLPRSVGVVTSPKGAVVHDILRTLRLHRAHVDVLLYPAQVQGEGAAETIVAGIAALNERGVDVMIVGRGGGSAEDLWCFNEESVARAIAASKVPVISAVGHETDFTIADFTADTRAATPTAAAQLVATGWEQLERDLRERWRGLVEAMEQMLAEQARDLEDLVANRAFETVRLRLAESRRKLEASAARVESQVQRRLSERRTAVALLFQKLARLHPAEQLVRRRETLRVLLGRLDRPVLRTLQDRGARLSGAAGRLDVLSPLASLGRGYSIARRPGGAVVSSVAQVRPGQDLDVMVKDGTIGCRVAATRPKSQDSVGG